MANVSDLVNAYEGRDFARPNLFKVIIPFLGGDFEFRCKAASEPPTNNGTVEVSYLNRKIKIPGDPTFEPWTVTVYNDDEQNIRERILEWNSLVNAQGDSITSSNVGDVKKEATVQRLNRQLEVVKEHTVAGIWPQNVAEIELDWENNDQVEQFAVTFEIDYHQRSNG